MLQVEILIWRRAAVVPAPSPIPFSFFGGGAGGVETAMGLGQPVGWVYLRHISPPDIHLPSEGQKLLFPPFWPMRGR